MPQQTFTSQRTTPPDVTALRAALKAAVNDPAAALVWTGEGPYTVKKATAWTAPQITAAQTAIDTAPASSPLLTFTATSRGKDILATVALIKRAQGIAAWNAMTVQQKKDAALAEADVWVTIRDFIETNL